MATNYSQDSASDLIQQYQFRVEALSSKIEELQAKIEVSQLFKKQTDGRNKNRIKKKKH